MTDRKILNTDVRRNQIVDDAIADCSDDRNTDDSQSESQRRLLQADQIAAEKREAQIAQRARGAATDGQRGVELLF